MDMIPQDNTPYKMCSNPDCKNPWLPATSEYFHLRKDTRSGLSSHCKQCRNAKGRKPLDAPEGYRRCSACKNPFPATTEFFSRHHMVKKDGIRSQCKDCLAKKHLEYTSDPEVKERLRTYGEVYQNLPEIKKHRCDHSKVYRKRPEVNAQLRINKHNRRAREKNAQGTYTPKEIQEQYARQKGKCYYCQHKVKWGEHHVDHVIPLSRGGSNDISNLVIACPTCNLSKHNSLPHEWIKGGRLL